MEQNTNNVILLVEDNPGDIALTKEAFEEAKVLNKLCVVEDGEKAIQYLSQSKPYEDATIPDVILLDLNLPKKSGLEVLDYIKNNKKLKKIPVIVLTSSKAEEDIVKSYDLYANSYMTKPVEFDNFVERIKAFDNFWLNIVRLPPNELQSSN